MKPTNEIEDDDKDPGEVGAMSPEEYYEKLDLDPGEHDAESLDDWEDEDAAVIGGDSDGHLIYE